MSILFFGSFRPDKGLDNVPKIAELVWQKLPDVKFIVAGNREWPKELNRTDWPNKVSKILDYMRRQGNFQIHDYFIPDQEIGDLFSRASIVILPYKNASQSGVIAIAFPFKCAVVAFNVGDLGCSILNNHTGILIEPENCKAFSDAIVKLLQDANFRNKISQDAYVYSKQILSWERIAQSTMDLYDKVLRNRP